MTKDEILSEFFGGNGGGKFEILDKEQLADKEFILDLYKRGADINQLPLNKISKDLRSDRDEVLAAVKQNGWSLDYADESLQKDREIVMAAVREYGNALSYASKELQKLAEG